MPPTLHTATSPGRPIVSESTLLSFLREGAPPRACVATSLANALSMDRAQLESLLAGYRADIEENAEALVAYAKSNLSNIPSGCLYRNLEDRAWRQAALLCEVFRHPEVTKNAGWLDTHALQQNLHAALGEGPLALTVAWGQAKRDAGGLKTAGPWADLTELYAISRLLTIVRALGLLRGSNDVTLTVQSGGERFQEALLTPSAAATTYDAQRQQIADALSTTSTRTAVTFEPYRTLVADDTSRMARYAKLVGCVGEGAIADRFDTILVNVDWSTAFGIGGVALEAPHGIDIPSVLHEWLESHDAPAKKHLVRAAIACIARPRAQPAWQEALGEPGPLLQETINFMRTVAWEATRSYVALQAADALSPRSSGPRAVRLTVHEKHDRRDIPALLTLGTQGGNALSQHVVTFVAANKRPRFSTIAELGPLGVTPVRFEPREPAETCLFGWLAAAEQPLCFVDASVTDPARHLESLLAT